MITTRECRELANRLSIAWPEPQNPLQLFYVNNVWVSKEEMRRPDFRDARFVLQEAMKMDYWEDFLQTVDDYNAICGADSLIPVSLVIDNTGKLAKLLLEYLRRKE